MDFTGYHWSESLVFLPWICGFGWLLYAYFAKLKNYEMVLPCILAFSLAIMSNIVLILIDGVSAVNCSDDIKCVAFLENCDKELLDVTVFPWPQIKVEYDGQVLFTKATRRRSYNYWKNRLKEEKNKSINDVIDQVISKSEY